MAGWVGGATRESAGAPGCLWLLPDEECGGSARGRESDSGEKRPPRPDFFSFFTSLPLAEEVFSEERLFESGSFLTGLYGDEGSLKLKSLWIWFQEIKIERKMVYRKEVIIDMHKKQTWRRN